MEDIGPYIERGQLLLAQGKASEAEKFFTRALAVDPENHHVLAMLAKCRIDQKDLQSATKLIGDAIRLQPEEDYYYYLAAFTSYQQDQNARAIDQLHTAINIDPYVSAYYGLYASILNEEKQFTQALEKANTGLQVDADDLTCLNARATALNKLKRTEDAVETMQTALAKDPENEITHVTVGWNLLEKGKHREARKHFKEALRLNPNMEYARSGLKESLKSRVAPYRWLLRYNFWVTNKSKKARWVIPIAIFIGVRLFAGASAAGGMQILGVIVLGLYLLFVATSWVINPLANFFLLFDSDGKYAMTNNERWNAICFTSALLSGLLIVITAFVFFGDVPQRSGLVFGGLIITSLAVPLGHMHFPWTIKGSGLLQWYSKILVCFGVTAAIASIAGIGYLEALPLIYLVGFVAYMWVHAFSSR